jgi:hypothetical protein
MDYAPWIFVALALLAVGILGWGAIRYLRAEEARRQEALARYQRAIDASEVTHRLQLDAIELTKTGHQLTAESSSIMRELITELRAGRQAPGAPRTGSSDSN